MELSDFVVQMHQYFKEEKLEALVFMLVGALMMALAVWFWWGKTDRALHGMAWPLLLIACIQLVVGASVYFRTEAQVATLTAQVTQNPEQFVAEEMPRMETVNQNFDYYKIIEIVLLGVGVVLVLSLWKQQQFWWGVGLGLALQAGFMLTLDFFAERRANQYTQQLEQLALQYEGVALLK